MARSRAREPFARDVRRRIKFESDARKAGLSFDCRTRGSVLECRFCIGIPGTLEERQVSASVTDLIPRQARVKIDGPVCARHRFDDDSLCMWWGPDADDARWCISDGLLPLSGHVQEHAWCEAECRAGRPWPKEEAPGNHARRPWCPTCRGEGE